MSRRRTPYECPICHKTFTSNKHQGSHTVDKPYKCASCRQDFKTQERLDKHIQVQHKSQLKHQCSLCGRLHYAKKLLEEHISTYHHSDEKIDHSSKTQLYRCKRCTNSNKSCDRGSPCTTCIKDNTYCSYDSKDSQGKEMLEVYIPPKKQKEIGYLPLSAPVSDTAHCVSCLSEYPNRFGKPMCSIGDGGVDGPCANCQVSAFGRGRCVKYLQDGHVRIHQIRKGKGKGKMRFAPEKGLLERIRESGEYITSSE